MSRRVIDVAIRSEFRKGFGDVARQMEALTKQLKSVEGLQNSVNKLADKFDRASTYKKATENAKKFADNQKTANKSLDEGVKVANRYESAQTKLARSLGALTASQKAGSISNKQRVEAEIGLLNQYIKKTKDLSVLDSRKTYRGARGQFTAFTKDALRNVSDSLAKATETGLRTGSQKGATALVQQMRATTARIKGAVGAITASGYQASFANRGQQASFYDNVWGSQGKRNGAGMGTQDLINRNTGVRPASPSTGLMLGEDSKFNQLKLHYQQLEQKAATTKNRIGRMNFGPNPAASDAGFKKVFDQYNRLGHFLFQLQYSTMTIFGLSGIGMILNQADAYITLRNQVARTSESINDLGANMNDVYRIAMSTFSDTKGVGKIFSTINKFSGALGLDRQGVAGVTEAISGAFGASPGNAQEKAASQYQFMQAIQSNRLGGDELRSVLEMAPFVGDVLAKGLAKLRGMPEGSVLDLRAQGKGPNPIDAKEIVKVFADPAIQAEIRKTLGEQARTFGDLLMVGKTRLMMLTEQFNNSTGIFSALTRMISSFLGNDVKFDKFTQALQFATAALVIYGGMLGVQAAGKGVSKLAQGASGLMTGRGLFSPASIRLAGMQTDALGRGISGAAGAVGRAPGAIANGATAAMNGVGVAANAMKTPLTTVGKLFTGTGALIARVATGIAGGFGRLLGGLRGLNFMAILTTMARGAGIALNVVGRALFAFNIPLVAIAAIIAALVVRFNTLLGAMTGGMNIMDILRGTWEMLMDSLGKAADFLSNSFLGTIWNAITGFIDGILKFVGRQAAGNTYFQEQQSNRMYDRDGDGRAVMHGRDGKNYYTRVVNGVVTRTTEEARNEDGSWRRADFNAGDQIRAFNPNLPSGQRSNLPAETPGRDSSGNKGPKDPWPEYMRDLRLKVQALTDLIDIPEQFRDIKSSFDENRRRAMDVMNFDSSGYDTLTEAWTAFAQTNALKATQVEEQNKRLNDIKIADSLREFVNALRDTMNGLKDSVSTSSMGGIASSLFAGRRTLFDQFISSPEAQNTMTETSRQALITQSGGDLTGAIVALTAALTPDGQARFGNSLVQSDQLIVDAQAGELEKRARESRATLDTQIALQNVFGRQKSFQEEILNLRNEQAELVVGVEGPALDRLNEQYGVLVGQVRERAALEESNRRNYATGLTSALAEYRDGLNDLAGDTSSLFSNALKGIEDSLTSLITTGKMNLTDFLAQMQQEVGRLFVRQILMKPLTGMLDKMFGNMFGMQDQTINANNVFINSTGLGSIMGGASGVGNSLMGGLKQGGNFMSGILRTGIGMIPGIGPILSSLFHTGGTAGGPSASRYVNPGVFAGAMRYHTGTMNAGGLALGVNEIPAILNRGEKVLTASQYSAMNNGGSSQVFSPSVNVTYHAGNNSEGGGGSSAEDAKAMGAMVKASVDQAIMDYDRRSRRPGSPGYLNNKK